MNLSHLPILRILAASVSLWLCWVVWADFLALRQRYEAARRRRLATYFDKCAIRRSAANQQPGRFPVPTTGLFSR